MKKSFYILGIVVVLIVAYYLISPAFIVEEADEASPLTAPVVTAPVVKDNMEGMDAETKAEFEKQTEEMADKVMEMADVMPDSPTLISQGDFKPRAYEVEGKALLISEGSKKTLRFENFDTINGPDLRIYLSTDLGTDDFVEVSKIKATKGNINYDVSNIDTDKYNKVLVWCKPFGVLFSYAELA